MVQRTKRGHSGTQVYIMSAMILIAVIVLSYFSLFYLSEGQRTRKLTGMLIGVRDTAETVHRLGEGNRNTITIDVPKNVETTTVSGNLLTIKTANGEEYKEDFSFGVLGSLPKNEGTHTVPITSITGNMVKIGDAPHVTELIPNCVYKNDLPLTANLFGYDLDQSKIFVKKPQGGGGNGETIEYPSNLYTLITTGQIAIVLDQTIFPANPQGSPYYIFMRETSSQTDSNSVPLDIVPTPHLCNLGEG